MTDRKAKQTPLPDLLDRVPEDIVLGIPGDEPVFPSYTNIPIGKLAQEAAAELRRLHAENEAFNAENEKLRSERTLLVRKVEALETDIEIERRLSFRNQVAKLEDENEALLEALQALYDEQQGPPLIRHQAAWEAAMEKARAAIAKAEETR